MPRNGLILSSLHSVHFNIKNIGVYVSILQNPKYSDTGKKKVWSVFHSSVISSDMILSGMQ